MWEDRGHWHLKEFSSAKGREIIDDGNNFTQMLVDNEWFQNAFNCYWQGKKLLFLSPLNWGNFLNFSMFESVFELLKIQKNVN
jgi:hypothetical protein